MSRIRRTTTGPCRWSSLSLTVALLALLAAPVAVAADADHLIISEVATLSSTARSSSMFIEIVNPTGSEIALGDVYLTDATFSTNNVYYWRIAEGAPGTGTIGGGGFNDFHARFPAGAVIAAGDTLVVSVNGSAAYQQAYGTLPDFELYEDAGAPDSIPELEAVFPGSVHGGDPLGETNAVLLPTLSNTSESVVLYTWDGESDLVADLDYVFWGSSTSVRFDKTGQTVGAGTYLADTAVASQTPVTGTHTFFQSYLRTSADEGTEATSGGNGLTGHDETSESLDTSWGIAVSTPPAPPASFFATAPIFSDGSQAPTSPYDGQDALLSSDVAANGGLTGVDFMYTIDGGAPTMLAGADQGGGTFTATLPAQAEGAVVTWWAVATGTNGRTATWPVGAPAFSEGWTVGTAPEPGSGPAKLLMTEIATVGSDQEFVEIHNPGTESVDMSDYYLTDANYSPGSQYYWRIAEGNPGQTTVGGGAFADFHARFPDGFSIAAGDTIVVSMAGTGLYSAHFGFLPDIELWEDDAFPDGVQDMRWIFGDEINNSIINRTGANPSTPTLTNGAETVILYHWDGTSDFVTDIDVFHWKDPGSTTTSHWFSKTGQTVGGHTYLPEAGTGAANTYPVQADFGFSYQRTDATEGAQATAGANGVGGRDETSEDLANTFEVAEYDPSRPSGGDAGGAGGVKLIVEAKTFLPKRGESFPIRFVSQPRSETRLRIFDQQGRLVITLFDSRFNGAPSTLVDAPSVVVWDGLDDTYQPVRAGMYIAHLSVTDNATGEQDNATAPVVVATRLSN